MSFYKKVPGVYNDFPQSRRSYILTGKNDILMEGWGMCIWYSLLLLGKYHFRCCFSFVGFRSFHRKRHRHNHEGLWCYFRGYNWFAKLLKMLYFPNWYGDSYHMVFFYILCKNTISNTSPWTCVGKNVPWTSILCILVTFTHVQIEGTRIWTFFVLKKMLDRSALRTLNM